MLLSKLFSFSFFCNKKTAFSAINESDNILSVEVVLENCISFLPKNAEIEGILLLSMTLSEDKIIAWETIVQAKVDKIDRYYKGGEDKDTELNFEETDILFGYRPFKTAAINMAKACELAEGQLPGSKCIDAKLYFPLSPMDDAPIWLIRFEGEQTITLNAVTGKVE